MCTFPEVRLAYVAFRSHRVTTEEMMAHAPCSTESPNKCSPALTPKKICNINHLISRSAGICILGPVWWMNHFLSSLSLKTHCVQRLDCGGHQIQTGRRKYSHEYMKTLFREKHVEGKKNVFMLDVFKDFFSWDWCKSTGIISRKLTISLCNTIPYLALHLCLCLSSCRTIHLIYFN